MKIAIGSDHGGFDLKERLKVELSAREIDIEDVGCYDKKSVDYPDFTGRVGRLVSEKSVDSGIVICTTGIGASITANKYPGVRSALCTSVHMAEMSRRHNNSNVLALGADNTSEEEAVAILATWLENDFEGGRHKRRVDKIGAIGALLANISVLDKSDESMAELLRQELRQNEGCLNLIASENIVSSAVRAAASSFLGDKYASGYPGSRHYPGCGVVDEIERVARDRAIAVFGSEHANLQPYSGSSANMAVFLSILEPGDTILSMSPETGGHITHGGGENVSGRLYDVVNYRLNTETGLIDYDQVAKLAETHKPKLICVGDSLSSRFIDFKRFREVADATGAYLMADIAHTAGLVAAGCYPNPVPHCEFVTLTTHKTMRGPRGGIVLCQERFADAIDRNIYPGMQGGPHMNMVAAKAVALFEALQPEFKKYQQQVVVNAKALAGALEDAGLPVLSGGTDIHMCAADVSKYIQADQDLEGLIEKAGILLNIFPVWNPIETETNEKSIPVPMIRVGTACATTRGLKEAEIASAADYLLQALNQIGNPKQLADIKARVSEFMKNYPVE